VTTPSSAFTTHHLGDGLTFLAGEVPTELTWDAQRFEQAWALYPAERPVITMVGKQVAIPRWQQAFGHDYRFSNQTSVAAAVPALLDPLRAWCRQAIDPRLNGLLLNWYEGPGHYIGAHHDSTTGLVPGTPIVTLSFGETRTFRLIRGRQKRDFAAPNGTAFVLPYDTNLAWKHLVPKSARYHGRRISVTLRAFEEVEVSGGRPAPPLPTA
jgi:alkylated DNA repair dioxygenase AlkB